MTNKNNTRGIATFAIILAMFIAAGFAGVSDAPGQIPDVRGSWEGFFIQGGLPAATPNPISMNITAQSSGNFSGTFGGIINPPGTLIGRAAADGAMRFEGDSPEIRLTNGRAVFTDYGNGAAIMDGTVSVVSPYPGLNGPRLIRQIRPFVNTGGCPCGPIPGDYLGNWGRGGSGGPMKVTVHVPTGPITPTKFNSYLYLTINGTMHSFILLGTANSNGDIVGYAQGTTGRLIMTAKMSNIIFTLQRKFSGNFTLELFNGTVINETFSVTRDRE